jgi:quercetin dioxygenase-like cupin family protein
MKSLNPEAAARGAVAAGSTLPATAILHDSPDVRLVVFRLAPGQRVSPHRSTSSVMLSVIGGSGIISGERDPAELTCATGDVVAFEPGELHGMRADTQELLLLATITPRPGSR